MSMDGKPPFVVFGGATQHVGDVCHVFVGGVVLGSGSGGCGGRGGRRAVVLQSFRYGGDGRVEVQPVGVQVAEKVACDRVCGGCCCQQRRLVGQVLERRRLDRANDGAPWIDLRGQQGGDDCRYGGGGIYCGRGVVYGGDVGYAVGVGLGVFEREGARDGGQA